MITEEGAIRVQTKMDRKMQKELSAGVKKISLALLIIGAIGIFVFLACVIVSVFVEMPDTEFYIFLLIFALFFGVGIVLLTSVNKSETQAETGNKLNAYEFFSGYFTIAEFVNGENVANAKIYNTQIIKSRETRNFLFFYINQAAAYPVDKSNLTEAELNTLRGIFKLPFKGETVTLKAEEKPSENIDGKG